MSCRVTSIAGRHLCSILEFITPDGANMEIQLRLGVTQCSQCSKKLTVLCLEVFREGARGREITPPE